MKKEQIEKLIHDEKPRSAWARGVKSYALEMLAETDGGFTSENLLNGAKDWREYSHGGCALIYDADIAERLCTPSEIRKTSNGERQPNPHETWLDCQARALFQAAKLIERKAQVAMERGEA